MSSYFYLQADKNASCAEFLNSVQNYALKQKRLIYILNKPLTDQRYSYKYGEALILLSPKSKITVLNYGKNVKEFDDFVEDVLEDIGSISDKYLYKEIIGRPRQWRNSLLHKEVKLGDIKDIDDFFKKIQVTEPTEVKRIDLLISLFIGSINDIDRVKEQVPLTTLDKVKQKIQLFDGDQTRFVYEDTKKKRTTIQGLSGTGKTELLLHKLKDLYITDSTSSIYFTCHNKILADSLRKRIPIFFNFMKVEQQIEWEKRLWCTNAWGSASNVNSGAYKFITSFYQIPFYPWSHQMSFGKACKLAVDDIKSRHESLKEKFAFTYMFIDESQDFDEAFFELCELVTAKAVYIAGDIFQSIFDERMSNSIQPDFLLGKCYRTDPKTLMFAHGLGMGLFENQKLRWLEKREWEDCGYKLEVKDRKYYLNREPLRRFEDLDENFESIKIIEVGSNYTDEIVEILNQIRKEHRTVLPEDIGIIFLDQDNSIYRLADILEVKIQRKFKWSVNKAYETKEKGNNSVFVSNRNNVKGLEFPFVICVTRGIRGSLSYRNSLYTMLTRSFIKSYLVVSENPKSGLTTGMKDSLRQIISENRMVINEPTDSEKKKIRTKFEYRRKRLSHYDLMMSVFDRLSIDKQYHDKIFKVTREFEMIDNDEDTLIEFVRDNMKYLKEK